MPFSYGEWTYLAPVVPLYDIKHNKNTDASQNKE